MRLCQKLLCHQVKLKPFRHIQAEASSSPYGYDRNEARLAGFFTSNESDCLSVNVFFFVGLIFLGNIIISCFIISDLANRSVVKT